MPSLSLRPDELPSDDLYKLLVSAVVPRPIAVVSTVGTDGVLNLAPFSFFNVASVDPPVLMVAPLLAPQPSGAARAKDTLRNVQDTGQCVVNILSFAHAEAMNQTSAAWPPEISEFEVAGFTPVPSVAVAPPRVAEAGVAFECTLDRLISYGDHARAGQVLLLRVVALHLADAVSNGRYALLDALDPIGRLGGPDYVRVKDSVFALPRPELG